MSDIVSITNSYINLNVNSTCGSSFNFSSSGSLYPIGLTGTMGPIGLTGTMGPIGLTGTMGPIGLTGTMGPIGLTGTMGPIGLTGTMGPSGFTGDSIGNLNISNLGINNLLIQNYKFVTITGGASILTTDQIKNTFINRINTSNNSIEGTPQASQIINSIPNVNIGDTFNFWYWMNPTSTTALRLATYESCTPGEIVTGGSIISDITIGSSQPRLVTIMITNITPGSESYYMWIT
jgi:hypothetical protein